MAKDRVKAKAQILFETPAEQVFQKVSGFGFSRI